MWGGGGGGGVNKLVNIGRGENRLVGFVNCIDISVKIRGAWGRYGRWW